MTSIFARWRLRSRSRSATCVLFSVLPALSASRVDPIDALKQQSRSSIGGDQWWQGALVSTQIALVVVLLAGAGLLLRSFVKLNRSISDFKPTAWSCSTSNMPPRYAKGGAARAFMRDVEQRVEAELGAPATIVSTSPVRRGSYSTDVRAGSRGSAGADQPADLTAVVPRLGGFFRGARHSRCSKAGRSFRQTAKTRSSSTT